MLNFKKCWSGKKSFTTLSHVYHPMTTDQPCCSCGKVAVNAGERLCVPQSMCWYFRNRWECVVEHKNDDVVYLGAPFKCRCDDTRQQNTMIVPASWVRKGDLVHRLVMPGGSHGWPKAPMLVMMIRHQSDIEGYELYLRGELVEGSENTEWHETQSKDDPVVIQRPASAEYVMSLLADKRV